MSYTHLPITDDRDRDEAIAMQELRKSGINFQTIESPATGNPFESPVEEVEEPLLDSDNEKAIPSTNKMICKRENRTTTRDRGTSGVRNLFDVARNVFTLSTVADAVISSQSS